MSDPELPALATRAQTGDRTAFESIVRRTARMVYAQIVATVRDRQKAEDLTQETFITAWKALPALKETSTFSAWLLTLARNTTLDAIKFDRRQKRNPTTSSAPGEAAEDAPDPPDVHPSPPEAAQSAEACNHALQMLHDLPEDYRRPLMLRYLAGADYQTIKQQLALSDGALRGLLNRGMALLRERMTKQER